MTERPIQTIKYSIESMIESEALEPYEAHYSAEVTTMLTLITDALQSALSPNLADRIRSIINDVSGVNTPGIICDTTVMLLRIVAEEIGINLAPVPTYCTACFSFDGHTKTCPERFHQYCPGCGSKKPNHLDFCPWTKGN